MKFEKYCSDLEILPETQREINNLQSYLETKKIYYTWECSNVEKQNWYGKQFIEIPFGVEYEKQIKEYFQRVN